MPSINCKVEMDFKWTKYCFLSAAGADNNDANSNNIIITTTDTKFICSCCNFTSKRQSKAIKTC